MKINSRVLVVAIASLIVGSSGRADNAVAKLGKDQVNHVIRETLIPNIEWPRQTIVERVACIQGEASKVGLAVETSEALRAGQLVSAEVRLQNKSLYEAIRHSIDSTVLGFRITESGSLYFYLTTEPAENPSSAPADRKDGLFGSE
jgi:hypothetical protein